MSGVKVPPLGSVQDYLLQKFMIQETTKNIKVNSLIANLALATAKSSDAIKMIGKIWDDYTSLELGFQLSPSDKVDDTIEEMKAEYSKIQHLRPKLTMDKKGFYVVSGLKI